MSDQGEKTCPLCAEEMDLTDLQLKPCQCGYEICVWCWHQIMDTAEKDESEGRCPACRTRYDKEKIVATAANCRRLVADASMEKKKLQKAKSKTSEGRQHLSSVRVVRRNLVYIAGLPLSLADEDLLLHKEYFGQYGKVSKVSLSRTSAGTIQQFPNNTCSVYITYSKEEEAVRCIQSIHGFTLEGNFLRAGFGTTKYCHTWLRNAPCTNPDCLYLHEIGSQEDSFTKDEQIPSYSRVQEITGVMNNLQRHSGDVFPPPIDDYCHDNSGSTGKPVVKSTPTNLVSSATVSPPTRSAGRTGALPATASWGARASNCQSSSGSLICSNGPATQNHDSPSAHIAFSAAVGIRTKSSVQSSELCRESISNDKSHPGELKSTPELLENTKQRSVDLQTNLLKDSHRPLVAHAAQVANGRQFSSPISLDDRKTRNSVEEQLDVMSTGDKSFSTDDKNHKVFPGISSINVDKQCNKQNSEVARPNGLSLDCFSVPVYQGLQSNDAKLQGDMVSSVSKAAISVDVASASRSDMQTSTVLNLRSEQEEDFGIQRLSDPRASQTSLFSSSHSFDALDYLRYPSPQHSDAAGANSHPVNLVVNKQEEYLAKIASNLQVAPNELVDNQMLCSPGIGNSRLLPNGLHGIQVEASDKQSSSVDLSPSMDVMEKSIIANILSLDMDAWDDSLTSQDLVKLLGENEQQGSFNLLSSRKAQNSNQSRFSFARQEEPRSNFLNVGSSFTSEANIHSFNPSLVASRESYLDRLGNAFATPQHNAEHYDGIGSNQSVFPVNRLPVSRTQVSAPPGFSVHSRIPPPGFSSNGISDQIHNVKSGNHLFESTSSLRNPYEPASYANSTSPADIEFIDPAILAVGKGRPPSSLSKSTIPTSPTFSSQTSAFENNSRLQLLMQRSLQPHQNHMYNDNGYTYSPRDAYTFSSRLMEPSQNVSLSPFSQFSGQPTSVMSNAHLDTWPQGMARNNMGIAELLRNNQSSFNKLYGGYEDSKFQISGSGDVYNRAFRM